MRRLSERKQNEASLNNFNLYTKIFTISSIVKIVNAILSMIDKNTPNSNLISALVSSPRVIALIIITRVIKVIKILFSKYILFRDFNHRIKNTSYQNNIIYF